jgi:putative ABC transport system permease protein
MSGEANPANGQVLETLLRLWRRLPLFRWRRTIALGFKSLWLHRLRSLLTVLGIVFGVCSVIAMLAVGEGASHEAQEQIRRLGSSNIIVRSMKPEEGQRLTSEQSYVLEYGLTYTDLRRIRESIPGVVVVVPGRIIRNFVWNARWRADTEIVGTVNWYPEMRKLRMIEGRYFSDTEMEEARNVCVLGARAAGVLFPMGSPIGGNVRVGSDYYKVIGVIESEGRLGSGIGTGSGLSLGDNGAKKSSSGSGASGGAAQGGAEGTPGGSSAGSESGSLARVYIPLTAAKSRFGEILMKRRSGSFEAERVELHEATVQVRRQDDVEETARIVREILAKHHKKKDFELIVPLELLRQAERTKQIFNIVLGAIAAISLIVGGIGIMNIMLASVTERTREIGIRRALGAKRRDIVVQFLVETVILSGAGGVLGVILGIAIPFVITMFANLETIVTLWAPAIAFSISGLVGIVFGIYPALRAANMDPVEALRHE